MRLSPQIGQANESLSKFFFLWLPVWRVLARAWIYVEKSRLFNQPTSCLSYRKIKQERSLASTFECFLLDPNTVLARGEKLRNFVAMFYHKSANGSAIPSSWKYSLISERIFPLLFLAKSSNCNRISRWRVAHQWAHPKNAASHSRYPSIARRCSIANGNFRIVETVRNEIEANLRGLFRPVVFFA